MVYKKTHYERPAATELQLENSNVIATSPLTFTNFTNEGFTPDDELIEF